MCRFVGSIPGTKINFIISHSLSLCFSVCLSIVSKTTEHFVELYNFLSNIINKSAKYDNERTGDKVVPVCQTPVAGTNQTNSEKCGVKIP